MTDLCGWMDAERFLAEDAKKLRRFVGITHEKSQGLRVESK